MAWPERLRDAAYFPPESPNQELRFQYEDVSRETDLRNTPFEFPNVDGAYVQPNGFGARQYPMRIFFSGDDHDLLATQFEAALLQRGPGKLRHPLYGEFDVIPVGRITRRDDLKSRANQSVIQVTFWTTTKLVYPTNQLDARNELLTVIDGYNITSAPTQFEAVVRIQAARERADLKATTEGLLTGVERSLGAAAATTTEVNQLFRDAIDAVNFSLDVLVGQPLQLAQQVTNLVTLPARAVTGFTDRVLGYANFARDIFSSDIGQPYNRIGATLPRQATTVANDFYSADLNAGSAINGAILSAVETQFETRFDAQAAALTLVGLFDEYVAWRELGFNFLEPDSGLSYQDLQKATALAAGLLVEISFSLLPERVLVLDRPRTVVDVAGELYGSVSDARLNDIINNNDLTGSQIIELERGDRIVWYG